MVLVHFHQKMRRPVEGLDICVRLRIWLTLRPLADAPATALLFGVEAAASRAWLARFRFGPLEWLWRTITSATRQPFYRIRPSRTLESV